MFTTLDTITLDKIQECQKTLAVSHPFPHYVDQLLRPANSSRSFKTASVAKVPSRRSSSAFKHKQAVCSMTGLPVVSAKNTGEVPVLNASQFSVSSVATMNNRGTDERLKQDSVTVRKECQ
ncbi:hypothetical protein E2C01_032161 [Portunus trituberculatus]|uniref:Uncharacterized protein n=1 Tax=Portunus trituberculatus TaxID=210409 RepID=A0A5B7EVB5_PORTR|nr:hypothetical protein [Portunus trituberculatus]